MRHDSSRRGAFLLEILLATLLLGVMLVPVLGLSTRNTGEHDEILERALAQGLALDMLERFERYKPQWPMPGTQGGPPLHEIFTPVELRAGEESLFDRVYLRRMQALGMTPRPSIERERTPGVRGLFRLTVTMEWRSRRGFERAVSFSRLCYAP